MFSINMLKACIIISTGTCARATSLNYHQNPTDSDIQIHAGISEQKAGAYLENNSLSQGNRYHIKNIQGLCLTAHSDFQGDLSLETCDGHRNNIWTFVQDEEVQEGYSIRLLNPEPDYAGFEWCMYFAGDIDLGVEDCGDQFNRETRIFKTAIVETHSVMENVVVDTITLRSGYNRFELQYNAQCFVSDPWNIDELLRLSGVMCTQPMVKDRLWHLVEAEAPE